MANTKTPIWVYAVVVLVVLAPGYLVWSLYPAVAAGTEEGRERQLALIFAITGLPLVVILLVLLVRRLRWDSWL